MKNNLLKSLFIFMSFISSTQNFLYGVSINPINEPKITFYESEPIVKKKAKTNIEIQNKKEQEQEIKKQEIVKTEVKQEIKKETTKEINKVELRAETKEEPKVQQQIAIKQPQKQQIQNQKDETIAFLYASNAVAKYGVEASNVAMAYLLNKNINFKLEFFNIEVENKQNITKALDEIEAKGIKKVIGLLTTNTMWTLHSYPNISKFNFYMPLVNKIGVKNPKPNFVFGGMDYKKQFSFLSTNATSNIVEIYDDSTISTTLHNDLLSLNIPNIEGIKIAGKVQNYNILANESSKLENSTVILNTSIVKSAIILSTLKEKNITPKEIFSTQLNYAPVIFNLTEEDERVKLLLTNSISPLPKEIEESISLFDHDVVYNWVNYSVVLGLEYFITNQSKLFGNIQIKDNQVDFGIKKVGFSGTRFIDL